MPEEVIQSTFTSTALNDLFPLWTEDPSKARPICMARFGTGDQAVDWTQTNVHNPVEKNITNVGISVITGDSTTANVRVAVEVTNSTDPVDPLRGKVLKEMGLFIDDRANPGTGDPVWKMVWVSKLPDMRVPTLEESGITMSFLVTVPIKFDNSDQIHLITDNAQLETRMDNLENAVGEKPSGAGDSTLWQYVKTMNGPDAAKLKADNEDFTALQKYAYQMNRGQDNPSPVERKASYDTVETMKGVWWGTYKDDSVNNFGRITISSLAALDKEVLWSARLFGLGDPSDPDEASYYTSGYWLCNWENSQQWGFQLTESTPTEYLISGEIWAPYAFPGPIAGHRDWHLTGNIITHLENGAAVVDRAYLSGSTDEDWTSTYRRVDLWIVKDNNHPAHLEFILVGDGSYDWVVSTRFGPSSPIVTAYPFAELNIRKVPYAPKTYLIKTPVS